jgi:hypothetical protein
MSSDHFVMVRSMPCKLRSEVHINGQCIADPVSKGTTLGSTKTGLIGKIRAKRAKLMTFEGRKSVVPGYSILAGEENHEASCKM